MKRRFCWCVCLLLLASAAAAQTATDVAIKKVRVLGNPGGTSPTDFSRPGFDTILESNGTNTEVSLRAGIQRGFLLFDTTLKSGLNKNDSVTAVAAADNEPLSSTGALVFGATYSTLQASAPPSAKTAAFCPPGPGCDTANSALSDETVEKLRSLMPVESVKAFGVKATITRPAFKYRLTHDGTDVENERHTGVAVTAGAGVLWLQHLYLGASVGRETTWNAAGDVVDLCRPVADVPGVSQCTDTIVGPPTDKDGVVFSAVGRIITPRYVVAPRYEYRGTKGVKTFDLPLYFGAESNTPKLTGGVMYRLKNGDSSFFVFVGMGSPKFGVP